MAKKKKGRPQGTGGLRACPEVQDELLALKAIYGHDLNVSPDGKTFTLALSYAVDGPEQRTVGCKLQLSLPSGYPILPISVRVHSDQHLSSGSTGALAQALSRSAERWAGEGLVCAFELIQEAQEWLADQAAAATKIRAAPPSPAASSSEASSYDEASDGSDEDETLEQAFWAPRPSFDPGLFADDGVDAETQAFPGTRAPRLGGSTPARAVGGAVAKSGPSLDGASPARPGPSAAAKSLEGVFAASFAGAAAPGLDSGSASDGCPSSSSSAASSPTPSLSGPSRTRSAVLSTVRQRLSAVGRAVLPLSLHRFLEPETSGEGTAPGASSAQAEASEQESRAALRRDLLLGHLLYKVLGDGLESRAASGQLLEAVLRPLAADGIVPRWVAWALAQHPEVLRRAFERLFKEERARAGGGRARAFWRMGTRQQAPAGAGCGPSPISALPASRYASDFAELHRLGRGGFGVVVSAMNRMDGRMYAVKKIPMQDRAGSAARILREVTTLSRLQHPHVVRYFQAWAETAPAAESRPGREKERPAKPGEGSGAISSLEWWQKRSEESEEELEGSESEEELSTITESSDEDDEEGLSSGLKAASSSCRRPASSSSCRRPASSSSLPLPKHRRTRQLLYIQMEYCPRTLQGVLSTPDALGDAERWQVLRQVLSALAYIHSQGVIHRDLKPANIFYDARGDVRLGDFGLAKHSGAGMEAGEGGQSGRDGRDGIKGSAPREPQDSRSASLPPLAGEHTTGVGTQSYISPEIAEGWPTYDERVDLYSLGVVALELWAGFRTGMERALSLRRLREQGELPAELEEAQPAVCRLIRWLASPRPEGRPTAKEALASNLLPPAVNSVLVSDVLRSLPEAPEVQERVLSALFALGGGESSAGDKDAGASEQEARPGQATGDIVPANRRPALPASLPPTAHPASSQLPFWAPEDLRPGAAPAGTPTPQQRTLLRAALARALEEVLARHGALRTASAELGAPARGGGPEVLTRGGACLALRSECRAPLVAWAARRADELPWGFRRLEVCTVWKAGGSGGAPQAVWQAEIDFVAPRVLEEDRAREAREGGKGRRRGKRREEGGGERRGQDRDEGLDRGISQNDAAPLPPALVPSLPASDPPQLRAAVARQLPLAELALACCASLARFRELEPLLELRLSHRALPSLLFLSGRDGQPEDGPAAAEALALFARQASPRGPARAARWPRLEASLRARSRVGEEMLGRVRALVLGLAAAQGEPAGTLRALRALLAQRRPGAPASAALGRALEALESLAQAVQAWGAGRLAVVIDPWLAVWDEPGCAFGLFAAASAEGSSAQARLLGAGGRTDAAFARAGGRACELGGVGATLNLDRAVRLLAQAGAGAGPGALPGGLGAAPALDAVVGVRGGGGLLLERLALVRLLREGGLSAELAPGLAPSAREQFGAAAGRGAAWLVVLHAASFLADNTVHVKLLGGRVEEDVPLEELAAPLPLAPSPLPATPAPATDGAAEKRIRSSAKKSSSSRKDRKSSRKSSSSDKRKKESREKKRSKHSKSSKERRRSSRDSKKDSRRESGSKRGRSSEKDRTSKRAKAVEMALPPRTPLQAQLAPPAASPANLMHGVAPVAPFPPPPASAWAAEPPVPAVPQPLASAAAQPPVPAATPATTPADAQPPASSATPEAKKKKDRKPRWTPEQKLVRLQEQMAQEHLRASEAAARMNAKLARLQGRETKREVSRSAARERWLETHPEATRDDLILPLKQRQALAAGEVAAEAAPNAVPFAAPVFAPLAAPNAAPFVAPVFAPPAAPVFAPPVAPTPVLESPAPVPSTRKKSSKKKKPAPSSSSSGPEFESDVETESESEESASGSDSSGSGSSVSSDSDYSSEESTESDEPSPQIHVTPLAQPEPEPKKKKEKKKKSEEAAPPPPAASGPSNALEAQRLRDTMGFAAAPVVVPAPALPAALEIFAFGFSGAASQAAPAPAAAAPVQAPPVALATGPAPTPAQAPASTLPHPADDEGVIPRRVYVGGMPYRMTENDVAEYWAYCGEIEALEMMTFPDTGRFKGIVFITFATEEGYRAALDCHGMDCHGQTLKVQPCKGVARAPKAKAGGGRGRLAAKTPGYNVAYCCNMSFDATEKDVKTFFETCGASTVRLHTDKVTNQFRGMAHVHFRDEAGLDRAVAMDGTDFLGRELRVGYAQPKQKE